MSFYLLRKHIRRLPGKVIKAVPLPDPEIISGYGKISTVGDICMEKGYRSVLLVTDSNLYSLGYHESIVASLEKDGIPCSVFSDISSEPTTDIVTAGRKAAEDCGADCIVALGGGSVLDSSKIIAAGAKHPRLGIGWFLQKFVLARTLPLITIPSTAGTGAEETVGAVVKNKKGVKKASVIVGLDVEDVILDSELTENIPERVTVCCGIDALSHGLEGCVADIRSTDEDIRKSRECVKLVMENLIPATRDIHNSELRQKLSLAANYGGNAINRQLAGYVHAFAHTIGGYYHISHGEAIAWCLLPVMEYQKNKCLDKLAGLSVYCGYAEPDVGAAEAADAFLGRLRDFLAECGFSGGFSKLRKEDYRFLTKGIDSDSINYSPPETFSDREISMLLDRIREGTK